MRATRRETSTPCVPYVSSLHILSKAPCLPPKNPTAWEGSPAGHEREKDVILVTDTQHGLESS